MGTYRGRIVLSPWWTMETVTFSPGPHNTWTRRCCPTTPTLGTTPKCRSRLLCPRCRCRGRRRRLVRPLRPTLRRLFPRPGPLLRLPWQHHSRFLFIYYRVTNHYRFIIDYFLFIFSSHYVIPHTMFGFDSETSHSIAKSFVFPLPFPKHKDLRLILIGIRRNLQKIAFFMI